MFCKNCGSEIPDNVAFCGKCGTPAVAEDVFVSDPVDPNGNGQKKKKSKKPIVAVALAAVLVAVIVVVIGVVGTLKSNFAILTGVQKLLTSGKTVTVDGRITVDNEKMNFGGSMQYNKKENKLFFKDVTASDQYKNYDADGICNGEACYDAENRDYYLYFEELGYGSYIAAHDKKSSEDGYKYEMSEGFDEVIKLIGDTLVGIAAGGNIQIDEIVDLVDDFSGGDIKINLGSEEVKNILTSISSKKWQEEVMGLTKEGKNTYVYDFNLYDALSEVAELLGDTVEIEDETLDDIIKDEKKLLSCINVHAEFVLENGYIHTVNADIDVDDYYDTFTLHFELNIDVSNVDISVDTEAIKKKVEDTEDF